MLTEEPVLFDRCAVASKIRGRLIENEIIDKRPNRNPQYKSTFSAQPGSHSRTEPEGQMQGLTEDKLVGDN